MANVYVLESGISRGSEKTKTFFRGVKLFTAKKLANGSVLFKDINTSKTLTTSEAVIDQKTDNYAVINTRNSDIHLWKVEEPSYNGDLNLEKVLCRATYKGFEYLIVDRGMNPCCYIKYTGTLLEGMSELVHPTVHGGVSYTPSICSLSWDGEYIGWDYGHCNDYFVYSNGNCNDGHLYTVMELIRDCQKAIDELDEVIDDMLDEDLDDGIIVDSCLYSSPLSCG